MNALTPAPSALNIAQARIIQNWIPELSAADPLELAKLIPEMLTSFRVVAVSRLRSASPRPVVVFPDLHEEEVQ